MRSCGPVASLLVMHKFVSMCRIYLLSGCMASLSLWRPQVCDSRPCTRLRWVPGQHVPQLLPNSLLFFIFYFFLICVICVSKKRNKRKNIVPCTSLIAVRWSVGFVQANLVCVPRDYAYDFLVFCLRNPQVLIRASVLVPP